MTGKDLIDYIRENNAEELEIMLIDEDSWWQMGRLKTETIRVEDIGNGKHLVIY